MIPLSNTTREFCNDMQLWINFRQCRLSKSANKHYFFIPSCFSLFFSFYEKCIFCISPFIGLFRFIDFFFSPGNISCLVWTVLPFKPRLSSHTKQYLYPHTWNLSRIFMGYLEIYHHHHHHHHIFPPLLQISLMPLEIND